MPKRPTSISNTISSKTSITFLETNAWSMVASKRAKVRYATSSWNLPSDIALLPNIPPYYIPSTTYAVLKGTTPQIVANSIVDVISRLSCVGEYNENQACALIQSIGNVKLSINLYKNEKNNILVEVHRIDGDVIEYHSLTRAILQATRQKQLQETEDGGKSKVPLTLKKPPKPTVFSNRIKSELQSEDAANKTIENIQNLIKKDRTDAVILGLESLAMLTSASSSIKQVQLLASKAVLCNDSPWTDMKGMLFGTIMDCNEETKFEKEQEDSCPDEDDSEYDTKLRLALTIIGNSANALCQYEEIQSDSVIDLEDLKQVLSILNDYVKGQISPCSLEPTSSVSHIQTVYQASRCIFFLITLSKELKNMAKNIGVLAVASDCLGGGCTKHTLFADISQEIVAALGGKTHS